MDTLHLPTSSHQFALLEKHREPLSAITPLRLAVPCHTSFHWINWEQNGTFPPEPWSLVLNIGVAGSCLGGLGTVLSILYGRKKQVFFFLVLFYSNFFFPKKLFCQRTQTRTKLVSIFNLTLLSAFASKTSHPIISTHWGTMKKKIEIHLGVLAAKSSPCMKLTAYKVKRLFLQDDSRALKYKFIHE